MKKCLFLNVFSFLLVLIFLLFGFISMGIAQESAPLEMKLATIDSRDHPEQVGWEFFVDLVKKSSGGNIQIDILTDGQLGNAIELTEACALGSTQNLAKVTLSSMTNFVDLLRILDLPFIWKNEEHLAEVMSGPIGDELAKIVLKESGIRVLCWTGSGFQGFYTNFPLKSLEDLQGKTMRVMDSQSRVAAMNAYGARAVTIAWPETYAAFQQGIADGGENSIPVVYSSKQHEVLPYYTISNHNYCVDLLIISEKYFQQLTNDQKNILLAAGALTEPYIRKSLAEYTEECKEIMVEQGAFFKEMKPDVRESFKEKIQPVWEEYLNTAQKREIMKKIQEIGGNY